jgi:glutamate-ammonia-ligase adenylyltransferase
VAGDASVFEEVREAALTPALWGTAPDRAQLAAEIRRMRERIEAEIGREAERGPNPKAGRGGLIDVEFAAQFLQLAHGHDHPSVRTTSTPEALVRLHDAGLLADGAFAALAGGYEFLRRLDLRLRIVHDYTVDHLPQGRGLLQLARRLGYYGDDPTARFRAEYARVTAAVRRAFEEVVR